MWLVAPAAPTTVGLSRALPAMAAWLFRPGSVSYTHLDVYKRQSQSTTQATGGLLSGMLSSSDEDTAAQKNSDGTVTCLLYTSRCV